MRTLHSASRNRVLGTLVVGALVACLWGSKEGAFGNSLESSQPKAGGEGSVANETSAAFSLPMRNVTRAHRRDFLLGNSLFSANWVSSPASVKSLSGLGPVFNARSCSTCHLKDGRSAPPLTDAGTSQPTGPGVLFRLSLPGMQEGTGAPRPVPGYGDQLNPSGIVGVSGEGEGWVKTTIIPGKFADGSPYQLHQPVYEWRQIKFGDLPPDVRFSPRVAPQVIGLGLLEAIPEQTILAHADPDDRDGDGVSGRPNWVWDVVAGRKALGRFGWKANQPNVHQQNAGAFLGDMGITSPLFPLDNCVEGQKECLAMVPKARGSRAPEIDAQSLEQVTVYIKTLAVPLRRQAHAADVLRGEELFREAKCSSCHIESMVTGKDPQFPENSEQTIFPYTDLLLHDMGPDLADNRDDFEANGREWRTPPLWGIGLVQAVNHHTQFLHDGRARSLEEAILWHGGEGAASKERYVAMPLMDRKKLLQFLESL